MLLTLLLTPHSFFYSLLSCLLSEIKISDIGKPTGGESPPALCLVACCMVRCMCRFQTARWQMEPVWLELMGVISYDERKALTTVGTGGESLGSFHPQRSAAAGSLWT